MHSAGPVSWGAFTDAFVDELAARLTGKRVLEIFAGNGLLASMLHGRGVDVVATSLFSSHDGHSQGMHFGVEEMEASAAVLERGRDRDVLLMSWPTSTDAAAMATILWGPEKPIVFIGEVTDHEKGHLGGCASDAFFEITRQEGAFESYRPRNMVEQAYVARLDPDMLEAWLVARAAPSP